MATFGGFQAGPFQPAPAFQQGTVVIVGKTPKIVLRVKPWVTSVRVPPISYRVST